MDMKHNKVVWSEGMLLTPQHYQQWDQYHENLLSQRLNVLGPFGWGITDLDIDHDGLANGRFALLSLRGVMPDGLVVDLPRLDMAPQMRTWGDLFQASKEQLDVYLAVPAERHDGINCELDRNTGARVPRYSAGHARCVDTNTGDNPRDVLVANKNLRILFTGEETADTVTLKIAELVRMPSGAVGLRETFIPPCLTISASGYLMRLLRGLLELLTAKTNSFVNPQRGLFEVVGMDLAKFSLVQALYSHLPVLTHIHHVEKVHPERLYLALARLAGQLLMLAPSAEQVEMPLYDHGNLAQTFGELDRKIRMIIEGVTPTRHVSIPLEAAGDNMWVGRVPESRLFGSSQFFVVVSGDLTEDQIRSQIPHQVKVGSPTKLKDIVAAAMPGVRLYHTPRPPATLPVKMGHQYFRLDDRGVFWEEIKKSQVVALHIPDSLQGLNIQLLAAKD
jgi:type VI secretion system protein ImpJ